MSWGMDWRDTSSKFLIGGWIAQGVIAAALAVADLADWFSTDAGDLAPGILIGVAVVVAAATMPKIITIGPRSNKAWSTFGLHLVTAIVVGWAVRAIP